MLKKIKTFIKKIGLLGIYKQLVNFKILAEKYNQFNTIVGYKCLDKNNNPIPWYTYPAIEFFNSIDFSDCSLFEWGCGYSTLYWGNKTKSTLSVEHNDVWANNVSNRIGVNQTLFVDESAKRYVEQLVKPWRIVVIDGIYREDCTERVLQIYKNYVYPFMIIFDNSDWFPDECKKLREELDLIQIDFHGFGPINAHTWTTSILFTRDYVFNPIGNQPNFSKAAIKRKGIVE